MCLFYCLGMGKVCACLWASLASTEGSQMWETACQHLTCSQWPVITPFSCSSIIKVTKPSHGGTLLLLNGDLAIYRGWALQALANRAMSFKTTGTAFAHEPFKVGKTHVPHLLCSLFCTCDYSCPMIIMLCSFHLQFLRALATDFAHARLVQVSCTALYRILETSQEKRG